MNHISQKEIQIDVTHHGAELQSLRFRWREFLYQKIAGFWQRQSPILFPIVGKLKGDSYHSDEKSYSMSQHGFLRDMDWEMAPDSDENSKAFRVQGTEETREKYPWDFEVRIRYVIESTTLRVEYMVTNHSDTPMPFSIGWHPAFHIDGDISDYSIGFEDEGEFIEHDLLDQDEKWLLSWHTWMVALKNGLLPLSEVLFQLDALIFKNLKSKNFHLLKEGKKVFTFHRGNFPHFALWKQPNAPFLCFEPWQWFSDDTQTHGDILQKKGMILLSPGDSESYFWELQFPN